MADKERRTHGRAKPAHDYVIALVSDETSASMGRSFNLAERLLDMSKKGVCVVTVGRLRSGLPVVFELALPGQGVRFRAEAMVRWTETVERVKGPIRRTAHVAGLELGRVLEARGEKLGPLIAWVEHKVKGATPEPRRRHVRFTPKDVEVICSPGGGGVRLLPAANMARRIKDLSSSGVQIVSARKLDVGQKVVLKVNFKNPRFTLVAEGEVLWCKRDTLILEPTFYSGIAFRNVTPDDQATLKGLEKVFGR